MAIIIRLTLLFLVLFNVAACTIPHHIATDYPQYLANNAGRADFQNTDRVAEYALTPSTEQHRYEFRAAVTGYANLWIVEFGEMLDATLRSADIQRAFGQLVKARDTSATEADVLVFDLQSYSFEDFGAHVALKISVRSSDGVVFEKIYSETGKSQGGKMFWGGAFAQKNAVQQSTKLALDEIMRQVILDLNASNW